MTFTETLVLVGEFLLQLLNRCISVVMSYQVGSAFFMLIFLPPFVYMMVSLIQRFGGRSRHLPEEKRSALNQRKLLKEKGCMQLQKSFITVDGQKYYRKHTRGGED